MVASDAPLIDGMSYGWAMSTLSTVTTMWTSSRNPSENDGRVTYLLLTPLGSERLRAAWQEHGPERDRLVATLQMPRTPQNV